MLSMPLYIDTDAFASGNSAYLRDLRDLLDAYLRIQAHQTPQKKAIRQETIDEKAEPSASQPPATNKRKLPSPPPLERQAIGYLLRALVAGEGRLLKAEMLPAVQDLGWTTKARTKGSAKNTLYAALDSYPHWINSDGDYLILTDEGAAFVQTLPPLPLVSNVTPEAP